MVQIRQEKEIIAGNDKEPLRVKLQGREQVTEEGFGDRVFFRSAGLGDIPCHDDNFGLKPLFSIFFHTIDQRTEYRFPAEGVLSGDVQIGNMQYTQTLAA